VIPHNSPHSDNTRDVMASELVVATGGAPYPYPAYAGG
jgi:hypothetical protein